MKKQLFIGLLITSFLFTACSKVKAIYVQNTFSVQVGSSYDGVVVSTKPQTDGLKIGFRVSQDGYEEYFTLSQNTKPCEKGEYCFTIEGRKNTGDKPIIVTFFVDDVTAQTEINITD